jgi:phosphatidylglycerophosphate synthase
VWRGCRAAAGLTPQQVAVAAWWLLWVATVLALWSLATYFVNVWSHFVAPQQPPQPQQPGSKRSE